MHFLIFSYQHHEGKHFKAKFELVNNINIYYDTVDFCIFRNLKLIDRKNSNC